MYQKTTLDNGLRILTGTMPHTRSVTVFIFVGVGSRYEPDDQAGISHFIEHMLFKGTSRRPTSREISEAIEGVGGILNGGTDKEITMYWCKVSQPHFNLALDVLTDLILHPRFEPEEIEKERRVIFEEINLTWDFPPQRAEMLMDELLWPNHPLGREIAGTRESVGGLTREMMMSYMANRYVPANTVITIAGNIQHETAVAAVSGYASGWPSSSPHNHFTVYKEQAAPRLRIEKKKTEQTHLCLGLPGLSLFDPRRFTLDLLNVILGEGMSSRLFTEVRDRLGLVYSVSSTVDHFLDSGSLTVCGGADIKNLRPAIRAILEQLAGLKEPIPDAELLKAKEMAKGRLMLRLEDSRSVAGWLGGQEILTGQILSIDDIIRIIESITAEDLQKLARELILEGELRLAIVGPVEEEPASLEELLRL